MIGILMRLIIFEATLIYSILLEIIARILSTSLYFVLCVWRKGFCGLTNCLFGEVRQSLGFYQQLGCLDNEHS